MTLFQVDASILITANVPSAKKIIIGRCPVLSVAAGSPRLLWNR